MRKIFSQKNLHPNISKQVLEYHKEVINEVEEAIEENQIVIVGMRWNDAVWQAKRNFRKAGKKFKYLEYGSYTNGWRKRLALKMWTGWPTFPMIFIDQKLIGGNSDLRKLLKSDKL